MVGNIFNITKSVNVRPGVFRRRLRTAISTNPAIYLPLARIMRPEFAVTRDTELVVEGFPRSGNSFTEALFRVSQSREIQIAHHLHSAAQVLYAVEFKIPSVVVFREPDEAVCSLLMHEPEIFSVQSAYWEYRRFYEPLWKIRKNILWLPFTRIKFDFYSIVDELNRRYKMGLNSPRPEDIEDTRVFRTVDALAVERGTAVCSEAYSPNRPESQRTERERAKERFRRMLDDSEAAEARSKAKKIFDRLNDLCNVSGIVHV